MGQELVIKYISVWGWQTLAMLFLSSSLIIFSLQRNLISQSLYVALFLIFVGCQFISLKRKKEIYNED